MVDLKHIYEKTGLQVNELILVCPYGSRIYGTQRKNSDYDFVIVTTKKSNEQYSDKLININFFTPEEHQDRLNNHEISALECYFLPDEQVLFNSTHSLNKKNKYEFKFNLDLTKLRHSLSAKSSNSWVKAKKKLTIEKDYDLDLGRKSLFHSFRIINYGIQIATHGKIVDYGSCNDLFKEIMDCYTWNDIFDQYKEKYNNICSEFRKIAPKNYE